MSRCTDEEDCKWQPWCRIEGKCRSDTTATPVTQASDTPRTAYFDALFETTSVDDLDTLWNVIEATLESHGKLERALATARADALEEAARIAERAFREGLSYTQPSADLANRIRAAKEKAPLDGSSAKEEL